MGHNLRQRNFLKLLDFTRAEVRYLLVEAAIRFAEKTGGRAAIGALPDLTGIIEGTAGTNVVADK